MSESNELNQVSKVNESNQAVETIEKKQGFILLCDPDHRCGTIISGYDRFWFHFNAIIYGPEVPSVKDAVLFDVSPAPKLPRKLAVANQIIIVGTISGTDALSQPLAQPVVDGQKADAKVGD